MVPLSDDSLRQPQVLSAILDSVDSSALMNLLEQNVLLGMRWSPELVRSAVLAVERNGLLDSALLDEWLARRQLSSDLPLACWIVASLYERRGEKEQALSVWSTIIDRNHGDVAEAYLGRARLYSQLGKGNDAYGDLRQAIRLRTDYPFLHRSASLYSKLIRNAQPPHIRTVKLAVLSSSTTDLWVPLLELVCFREGIFVQSFVASYGTFRQEIIDPGSALYRFSPEIVLIATHWRDAHLPDFSKSPDDDVAAVVQATTALWHVLLANHPCQIIQHNFDLPPINPYGVLSLSLAGGRENMLRSINRLLLADIPPSVSLLDTDFISGLYGKQVWEDPSLWHLAKQHPVANALPLLVEHQTALIRAHLGLMKKVLVLDLDNTLWGGVIGEDGVDGIEVGPPSAIGEAHQTIQRYARSLKDRGILLAVCSKNNEEDARQPFLYRDGMVLNLDDFVAFKANWRPKAENLRKIAQELNLGVDSLVLLDDNPLERALVRRELPEVAVPELGTDPADFVTALAAGRYFDALTLSREDLERHASYRTNIARTQLEQGAVSLEDFLRNLSMVSDCGPFTEGTLPRIVQLIGKTNQFNLTSRRYGEAEIRSMMGSADYWTQSFKLADRFGDYGLIGVMIARLSTELKAEWEIDTWLMSCRVLGRQMEQFMLQQLVGHLRSVGAASVIGKYQRTGKNSLVADLYERLGFQRIDGTEGTNSSYRLNLSVVSPTCDYILQQHVLEKSVPI